MKGSLVRERPWSGSGANQTRCENFSFATFLGMTLFNFAVIVSSSVKRGY